MKTEKHFFAEYKITDFDEEYDKKTGDLLGRTLVVTASDETVDRYQDIVKAKGCKYPKNGKVPVLWAHNRKEDLPPIGRTMWIKRYDNEVRAKILFAPNDFANSIFNLYEQKFLDDFSIGFIPIKERNPNKEEQKMGAQRIVEEWELLEISSVPIGANPNAKVERTQELIELREAVNEGKIDLPEMVYKDFGFEGEEIEEEKETSESEDIEKTIDEKPYKNFHSCDINQKDYDKYRVDKCGQKHDGKCIDVRYGIVGDKSEISSLLYSVDVWTKDSAKNHCKSRDGKFIPATKDITLEYDADLDEGKIIYDIHSNQYWLELDEDYIEDSDISEEESKDYIKVTHDKEIIKLKKNPQKDVELEESAVGEGIDIERLFKEVVQESVDSLSRDFRRNILGIVDDEKN